MISAKVLIIISIKKQNKCSTKVKIGVWSQVPTVVEKLTPILTIWTAHSKATKYFRQVKIYKTLLKISLIKIKTLIIRSNKEKYIQT